MLGVFADVQEEIRRSQGEASRGIEDAVARADRRNVDTLREVVAELQDVKAEIRRLR